MAVYRFFAAGTGLGTKTGEQIRKENMYGKQDKGFKGKCFFNVRRSALVAYLLALFVHSRAPGTGACSTATGMHR